MAVTVRIPTPLRPLTGGKSEVSASGTTVLEVIEDVDKRHPGVRDRLLDGGKVRRFVNIFVGPEDIRFLDGPATVVQDGAELSILPAIAGGSAGH